MIRRNPCRIKGAGQEKSPERPVLTIRQVFALAAAIEPRYRALVLLAVFASLRWGELAALRRGHIDLASGTRQRQPRVRGTEEWPTATLQLQRHMALCYRIGRAD